MTLAGLVLSLPIPRSALRSVVRALAPKRRARLLARLEIVGLGMALAAGAVFLCRFGGRRGPDEDPHALLPRSAAA